MKTSSKRLSLFVTVLFSLISAASTAADMSGLNNLSPDQNSARVIESVSGGLFYDSTGASKSMMSEGYSDLCYNLEGIQTELPTGYTMVRPGYCRRPCVPISGVTIFNSSCNHISDNYTKTGYVIIEHRYTQYCTGPYGTRSIANLESATFQTNCVLKEFSEIDFFPELRLEDSGATVNFGIKFGFKQNEKNKYLPTWGSYANVQYTAFKAYKSCNNPYKIREVVVGSANGIQPDPIIGQTVSDYWYKAAVSDSNCNKVNFAGPLYIAEESHSDFEAQNNKKMTLRGLNQSKKTTSETNNGYQITLYNISNQEIIYCFGKFSADTGKWNHYSQCKDRDKHTDTPVYGYTTGYTEPELPTPPAEKPMPETEPYDPYESPEMFSE